jgi:hypothetical protein
VIKNLSDAVWWWAVLPQRVVEGIVISLIIAVVFAFCRLLVLALKDRE